MTAWVRLACSGFARTLRFYTDVLGFTTMRFEPEARRAQLERDGVVLEIAEGGAADAAAALEYPFGRGVTLVVWTRDLDAAYAGVQAYGARLALPLGEAWRDEEAGRVGHRAFEVLDPDGYRLRFCESAAGG